MDNLEKEDELIELLMGINDRLEKLEKEIQIIKKSVTKMNDHVDFVNGIYDNVKDGFHNVMSLANRIPRPFYSGLIEGQNYEERIELD